MKTLYWCLPGLAVLVAALLLLSGADSSQHQADLLWHYRNLGKAFYENPTTQKEAVAEFKKALDLAPDSARERLNYGLALLRAGQTKDGVAELLQAQKQDPAIPHTWFNLGIAFKKDGDYERAINQFEHMIQLVPDEPVSHYNLGVLYRLAGKPAEGLKQLEIAQKLNPNLAGPHFQLFNQYRQSGRADEAAHELKVFQEIKKRQAGAAVPEDMEWSYYAEIYETVEPRPAEPAPAALKFGDRKLAGHADPKTAGLAALDFDGDGHVDLAAWSAEGVQLFKKGAAPVAQSGLEDLKGVIAIVPGDFDNDGLPDLCVLTESGAALYHNRKGVFEKSAAQLPAGRYETAVWMDYDHDGDLDLLLFGEKPALMRNNGPSGFSDQTADFPFAPGYPTSAAIFAVRHDTAANDLAVAYRDHAGVVYRDRLNGKFEAMPLEAIPAGTKSVVAEDYNNDGFPDLAAVAGSGVSLIENRQSKLEPSGTLDGKPAAVFADLEDRGVADLVTGSAVFRNHGKGKLARIDLPAGVTIGPAVVAADFNGDGLMDLAAIGPDGSLHLYENQTATHNHWLEVAIAGIKNLKLAPGATVEVKTGASYQKKIYNGAPLLFGLASYKDVDTVRITWPNGLIQNETKQPILTALNIKEAQRLSGSCPMIFAWNGKKFQFITDVLGTAPLGASSGDGHYFPVAHAERVFIPGRTLVEKNGSYEIRITEELREVSYLDEVQLTAVDHPAAVDIFTNDKFKSPPFPEFRLYGAWRRIYPVSAHDSSGRDVLARLIRRDRTYPDGFPRDLNGIGRLHHLDLDFGQAARNGKAVLILNGWVDWADGSTFLRASQESPGGLILPYLQVKDAAGEWKTVIEDMGIPAGKPKTIAVDLTGKWLSGSREVRIVTNLCVYWDEVFLSEDAGAPEARLTPVNVQLADLHFRGFSKPTVDPARKQPESFDYQTWMPVSMWNPTPGLYTRYGDVRPLVEAADDRMVIMGSGDELRLQFPTSGLPALQSGWTRDFLLLVDGWAKDGDYNTAYSQSVEPLPFHAMSSYPYPGSQHFPDDAAHRAYREQYNTRPALQLLRPLAGSAE
ncbi:MAG TPA: FG-GAP-like repeat-containing protein [Bryobacteraceae bacterium]|nr:FG-GAP-like repeat-containing protein [Bryobacteraceae bacterium]